MPLLLQYRINLFSRLYSRWLFFFWSWTCEKLLVYLAYFDPVITAVFCFILALNRRPDGTKMRKLSFRKYLNLFGSLNPSKHVWPLSFIVGWYILYGAMILYERINLFLFWSTPITQKNHMAQRRQCILDANDWYMHVCLWNLRSSITITDASRMCLGDSSWSFQTVLMWVG